MTGSRLQPARSPASYRNHAGDGNRPVEGVLVLDSGLELGRHGREEILAGDRDQGNAQRTDDKRVLRRRGILEDPQFLNLPTRGHRAMPTSASPHFRYPETEA